MRSSPQKKEEKERIRLALLRASLQLAAKHGFSSLGLREVSREGGIAPTSFYRHFADMEELGLAVIAELVQPLIQEVSAQAQASEDGAATLLDAMLDAVEADPELMRFVVAQRYGASDRFREPLKQELEGLAAQLVPGPSAGLRAAAAAVLLDACAARLEADDDGTGEPDVARQASRNGAVEALTTLAQASARGAE